MAEFLQKASVFPKQGKMFRSRSAVGRGRYKKSVVFWKKCGKIPFRQEVMTDQNGLTCRFFGECREKGRRRRFLDGGAGASGNGRKTVGAGEGKAFAVIFRETGGMPGRAARRTARPGGGIRRSAFRCCGSSARSR